MAGEDQRFVLLANNGDRLYPYIKRQRATNREGFALSKPGENDRHGQGTYTKSLEEVIRRVVFDGWSVRAKTADQEGRQRAGSFGLGKRVIIDYEIAREFSGLIASAPKKPRQIF